MEFRFDACSSYSFNSTCQEVYEPHNLQHAEQMHRSLQDNSVIGQQHSPTLLNSCVFSFSFMIISLPPQGQDEGQTMTGTKSTAWWKVKRWGSWPAEKNQNTPSRKAACVLWFRLKWGQLWLCLSPLLKWSITHVIFCAAAEECGPPCSTEDNKGGSRTLPTGVNCNISGVSQGKARRTTPLVIKRRERWREKLDGQRKGGGGVVTCNNCMCVYVCVSLFVLQRHLNESFEI